MTIAVAVRKADQTVLATDTLVHFGGERIPPHNCRLKKIYSIGDSLMAWAG